MKDFQLSDRVIAMIAPAIGGALFFGISVTRDILAGRQENILSSTYILEHSIIAAAGAILSSSIFISRYLISASRRLEKNYLQIPWNTQASERATQTAKIGISGSLQKLFHVVDDRIEEPDFQHLALSTVQMQLEEQLENIKLHGRVQFTNPGPNSSILDSLDRQVAEDFAMDGYCLIFNQAQKGDVIYATDFQNSHYWWLDPKVAYEFFTMNLQMLQKGVRIIRIFGRHHMHWQEDEAGRKQQLIELQASIKGMEIYTIDYTDFSKPKGFNIEPIDQLLLKRDSRPLPAIEWLVDEKGATDKVYLVFGQGRLTEMQGNFTRILDSGKRGSSLQRIEVEAEYDPCNADDYARIETAFADLSR